MEKIIEVVLYTMKGCPYCNELKELLNDRNISFIDRDIEENLEEYELFVKVTASELVPSIMIVEKNNGDISAYTYVPERDYNELEDACKIILEHYK